jgi:hypothetical protein
VERAGRDQRVEDRGPLGPGVGAGEEVVLAAHGHEAHEPLHAVVVDLYPFGEARRDVVRAAE